MARRDALGADLAGRFDQLLEFDFRVAQAARDGRLAGEITLDEGADDALLEARLEVDDVIGDAEKVCDAASIVRVVERAAAPGGAPLRPRAPCKRVSTRQPALVPELHRQADHAWGAVSAGRRIRIVPGQERRRGGAVHAAA